MVTGTLPYLGEANIKDPLYQLIKSKNSDAFWQTWKQYFKSQNEQKEDNEFDINFTSDDEGENEPKVEKKSVQFKYWIECLHKIASVTRKTYNFLKIVTSPIWMLVYYFVVFILTLPGYWYRSEWKQLILNDAVL